MNKLNLDTIYYFSKNVLKSDTTGHDWKHALRVEKNALKIIPDELSTEDLEIIRASCWLHDTIDPKLSGNHQANLTDIKRILNTAQATECQTKKILHIIQNLSFSKNIDSKQNLDVLGQIVQDADRLDAIGAIGIARAFYYGGNKNHLLYNDQPPRTEATITESNYRQQNSVVNHFYEKLLKLEFLMNTSKAKKIARNRTRLMEDFLDQLLKEIE